MTITSETYRHLAPEIVEVTVESDLTPPVYFHWYGDGAYLGMTTVGVRVFYLSEGESIQIEVLDTTDAAFDPLDPTVRPDGFPSHVSAWWTAPRGVDVDVYRVQFTFKSEAPLVHEFVVPHVAGQFVYSALSPTVPDRENITVAVLAEDRLGNSSFPAHSQFWKFERRPDPPAFTLAVVGSDVVVSSA